MKGVDRDTRDQKLFLVGEILGLLLRVQHEQRKRALLALDFATLRPLRDALAHAAEIHGE